MNNAEKNTRTMLDHTLLLLLVEAGGLSLGALCRLRRVDRETRALVDGAVDAFVFVATSKRWRALRCATNTLGVPGELTVLQTIRLSVEQCQTRCRECGAITRCATFLESHERAYRQCTACQRDAGGYLELVDRKQIKEMAKRARVPVARAMLALVAVRRGLPCAKFLYLKASVAARV